MFTGPLGSPNPSMEVLYVMALLNRKNRCKACGKNFTSEDAREFCSNDCRKSA